MPRNADYDHAFAEQENSTSLTSEETRIQGKSFRMTPNPPPAHGYNTFGGQRRARYSDGHGSGQYATSPGPTEQPSYSAFKE
jgi:hypothetical protein